MMSRPVFIIGLQKSGTSLLGNLLEASGIGISHSGQTEDNHFWGNRPSFSPSEWPAGVLYQKAGGENGHEIGADDATPHVISKLRQVMAGRLAAHPDSIVVFGKSPYNTVRIPWIRSIFPDSTIVALVRNPVPNAYSLWKRFQAGNHTAPPEDGWWGVKPKAWRSLVCADKVTQIAHQWNSVNAKLWNDRALIDLLIPYPELCQDPKRFVGEVVRLSTGNIPRAINHIPALRCFDEEYRVGSCLRSKNKFQTGSLFPADGSIELEPFNADQIATIEDICQNTATRICCENSNQQNAAANLSSPLPPSS